MFKSSLKLTKPLRLSKSVQLAQNRGFILASIAALTNSNFVKNIQLADEFEDTTAKSHVTYQKPLQHTSPPSKVLPNGRIDISGTERAILLVVSGINAFLHPETGANIVNFGEATSFDFILRNLRDRMLETPSGRSLLRERPSFDSESLDLERLSKLPENTLGYQYFQFTNDGDERAPVKFIKDDELAYVFQRYRQIHDIVHILTKSKIDLAGELPVKAFEFGNTGLPMTGLACFAYFKLNAKRKNRVNMLDSFLNGLSVPSLVGIRWEDLMERDVEELRHELGIITN